MYSRLHFTSFRKGNYEFFNKENCVNKYQRRLNNWVWDIIEYIDIVNGYTNSEMTKFRGQTLGMTIIPLQEMHQVKIDYVVHRAKNAKTWKNLEKIIEAERRGTSQVHG